MTSSMPHLARTALRIRRRGARDWVVELVCYAVEGDCEIVRVAPVSHAARDAPRQGPFCFHEMRELVRVILEKGYNPLTTKLTEVLRFQRPRQMRVVWDRVEGTYGSRSTVLAIVCAGCYGLLTQGSL